MVSNLDVIESIVGRVTFFGLSADAGAMDFRSSLSSFSSWGFIARRFSFCFSRLIYHRQSFNLASWRASSSIDCVEVVTAEPLHAETSNAEILWSLCSITVINCSILLLTIWKSVLLLGLLPVCTASAASRLLLLATSLGCWLLLATSYGRWTFVICFCLEYPPSLQV